MISKVILKSGKDQSAKRFHPWIFSGAIKKIKGEVEEGDIVHVYDNQDNFLGAGHYQIGTITVRIITFQDEEIDENFWNKKIEAAYNYRKNLGFTNFFPSLMEGQGGLDTNVFRLINAEGDGMPGLIIDFYNGTAVMQSHSVGFFKSRDAIAKSLKQVLGDKLKAVYDKSKATLPAKAPINPEDGYFMGESHERIVSENGLKFKINWEEGQKTGFFIDQRENRKLLGKYSSGKTVLNMFGYTGGFSVYALQGGAELVHSVDSSKKAIELTNENIELNFGKTDKHASFAVDAFEYLQTIDNKYDVIILDPPAFAKHQDALHNALQGYKKINYSAISQIKKGGILFTFSCSQAVSTDAFRKAVFSAAAMSGRHVRIMHQLTQPADHPVNIYHPEGEYLKGLVLFVE